MLTKDLTSSLVVIFFGLVYLFLGMRYDWGEMNNPHPGFFPRIIGILIIFFGSLLFVGSFWKRKKEDKLGTVSEGLDEKNVLCATMVLGSIVAYLLILQSVGFLIASAPLVWFLAWIMGGRNLIVNGILAVVSSGLLYWLFWIVMRVPVPLGSLWE